MVKETKLGECFLNNEIALEGFKKPYHFDITATNGGRLIYVKTHLPSKVINFYEFYRVYSVL